MGRQVFSDGVLVEKWDDTTLTYTGPGGARAYDADELAALGVNAKPDPTAALAAILAPTLASMDSKLTNISTDVAELKARQG